MLDLRIMGRRYQVVAALTLLIVFAVSGRSSYAAGSSAISQNFTTQSNNISQGALVSLVANSSNQVAPANTTNEAKLVGVDASKPLLELSSTGSNSIHVVVNGSTDALVSNMNGAVNAGDKITASPVSGIGMKASVSSEIVGIAQDSLNAVSTVQKAVQTTNGKSQTIIVGLLPISVNVSYYSSASSQGTVSAFVPNFLQTVANAISGKQVSPLRVLIGAVSLLLGFISVTVILYASIRNGFLSIGRNPLAQKALRRGLVDVIMAGIGILVITVSIVYAILLV